MKKAIATALILFVAVVLAITPVLAQEPVLVFPFFSPPDIDVPAGQEVLVLTGWVACTRGLVRSFLTSIEVELFLDGQQQLSVEEADEIWGPIVDTFPNGEPVDPTGCIAGNEGQAWVTLWGYSLGAFDDVGAEHPLGMVWTYGHPVNDGFDLDGDGKPDKYTGSMDWSTTLHIVP